MRKTRPAASRITAQELRQWIVLPSLRRRIILRSCTDPFARTSRISESRSDGLRKYLERCEFAAPACFRNPASERVRDSHPAVFPRACSKKSLREGFRKAQQNEPRIAAPQ